MAGGVELHKKKQSNIVTLRMATLFCQITELIEKQVENRVGRGKHGALYRDEILAMDVLLINIVNWSGRRCRNKMCISTVVEKNVPQIQNAE